MQRTGIDRLLEHVVDEGASDLYLREGRKPLLRIGGDLREVGDHPELAAQAMAAILCSLLDAQQLQRYLTYGNEVLTYKSSSGARFRTSFYVVEGAIGAIFRRIAD